MKIKVKKNRVQEECGAVNTVDMAAQPSEMAPPDFSGTPDFEGDMARSQMLKVHEYSAELMDMITPEMQLPAWVQAKLTKVADYMGAVKHFLEGEMKLNEKEFPDLTGDGEVTQADILKGRGVIDEDLIQEDFASNLKDAFIKIKQKVPNLEWKIILANLDAIKKAFSALRSAKTNVKEGFMQDAMAIAHNISLEYGLLAAGIALAVNNVMNKEVPDTKAIEMIIGGLTKTSPIDFFKDKGDFFAEDSHVVEGSCDDGEMYEMELFYEECGCGELASRQLEEAEYQGRKVPLNKPMRGDVKKFKVYVKDPSTGNVKKVNFGDPNMRIKKSNPARRKSFRARHNCKNPGPKTKARYWSCRKW